MLVANVSFQEEHLLCKIYRSSFTLPSTVSNVNAQFPIERVSLRHLPRPTYLLNEVNGALKVETEVDELPINALLLVLLLLLHEHVVVEELLQPFVGVVDAQLLKRVDGEDFETSNVEHTDEEVLAGLGGGVSWSVSLSLVRAIVILVSSTSSRRGNVL